MDVSRAIATLPVRSGGATWAKAKELILKTLDVLDHDDCEAVGRALDHLNPLLSYLLMIQEFQQEELVLDYGELTLRIKFLYYETSSERDDASVPVVAFIDEQIPGSIPTLTITTTIQLTAVFRRCLEEAGRGGFLRVNLLSPGDSGDDPATRAEDDEDGNRPLESPELQPEDARTAGDDIDTGDSDDSVTIDDEQQGELR